MTLSFSEKWADGSPTYFIPKIWRGIYSQHKKQFHKYCDERYLEELIKGLDGFPPKLHTIREDKKNRWKAGNIIHPVVNNRTPNRFQFAPTLVCHSTQKVVLKKYYDFYKTLCLIVYIDDVLFYIKTFISPNTRQSENMLQFVKNDGFDDIDSFFNFFFPNNSEGIKELKLIHWTGLKY